MNVNFKALCSQCGNEMLMGDTTSYDDYFHCEKCNISIEIRAREQSEFSRA